MTMSASRRRARPPAQVAGPVAGLVGPQTGELDARPDDPGRMRAPGATRRRLGRTGVRRRSAAGRTRTDGPPPRSSSSVDTRPSGSPAAHHADTEAVATPARRRAHADRSRPGGRRDRVGCGGCCRRSTGRRRARPAPPRPPAPSGRARRSRPSPPRPASSDVRSIAAVAVAGARSGRAVPACTAKRERRAQRHQRAAPG